MKKVNIIVLLIFHSIISNAQTWKVVGDSGIGCGQGTTCGGCGSVEIMSVVNDELFISGGMGQSCGGPGYGCGKWDGTKWDSLGWGFFNNTTFLRYAYFKQEIYIGGGFYSAYSGVPLNQVIPFTRNIAKWDGIDSVWHSISNINPNEAVYALQVYKDTLYVGGKFYGGSPGQRIARFDGTNWSAFGNIGGGTLTEVRCMAVFKDELYVGGDFTLAGGVPANYIARWNGVKWDSVGSGLDYMPNAMVVDTVANILYVGGIFEYAGGQPAKYIAKWDGGQWSNLGGAWIPGGVTSLAMYRGDLFVGGVGTSYSYSDTILSRWDGTAWHHIIGPNNSILSLATYNDELYVGGYFEYIDTGDSLLKVNYIARYWLPPVGFEEKKNENTGEQFKIYPNPAGGSFTIEIPNSKLGSPNSKLEIYDLKGRLIYQSGITAWKIEISSKNWAKGNYFVYLVNDRVKIAEEKIVIE